MVLLTPNQKDRTQVARKPQHRHSRGATPGSPQPAGGGEWGQLPRPGPTAAAKPERIHRPRCSPGPQPGTAQARRAASAGPVKGAPLPPAPPLTPTARLPASPLQRSLRPSQRSWRAREGPPPPPPSRLTQEGHKEQEPTQRSRQPHRCPPGQPALHVLRYEREKWSPAFQSQFPALPPHQGPAAGGRRFRGAG